jgi:small subunit ribosomal protein S4
MGDPRRLKNKYSTPIHPWEKLRLDAERPLMKEFGLVNKKELWKISSKLKNFKDSAKKLVASKTSQAGIEKRQMVDRMKSYGLIISDELDEILGLEVEKLLNRRLQTVVFKKGLARSIKQARQMITHRHIAVNGVKITAPGYLVRLAEEDFVSFIPSSKFDDVSHPERVVSGSDAGSLKKSFEDVVPVDKKDEKSEVKTVKEDKDDKKDEKKKDDKKDDTKEVKEDKKESKKEEEHDTKEVKKDVVKDDKDDKKDEVKQDVEQETKNDDKKDEKKKDVVKEEKDDKDDKKDENVAKKVDDNKDKKVDDTNSKKVDA